MTKLTVSLFFLAGLDNLAPSVVRKSRLKAKAKILIQLQSLQGKVLDIDKMLHTLQDLSDRCQRERIKVPRMRNCSKRTNSDDMCCEHDAIMKARLVCIDDFVSFVRNGDESK